MDEMQPPPAFCYRRTDGATTVISARLASGCFTLIITAFAAFWSLVVCVLVVGVVSKIMSAAPLMKEVNGVTRASSAAEYLLTLAVFVGVALVLNFAALFSHRGRVTFRIDHDSVRLFVGTLGIGRRVCLARASIRGVSLVSPRSRLASTTPDGLTRGPEHISLEGTPVTTGAALEKASRTWLAQELRHALGLTVPESAKTGEREGHTKGHET